MPDRAEHTPWRRFWEHGSWWKAVLVAVVYYGIYQAFYFLVGAIFPKSGEVRGRSGSAVDIFVGTGVPILLGGVVLLTFLTSVGWADELFSKQRIRGRGWMWIGVVVVLAINICALVALDYRKAGFALVASWLLVGLFIGFAEEVLTRGLAVNILRKGGYTELSVALISSLIFGALHLGNVFTTDQGLGTTLLQFVYTFFFGMIMYLALRVSGYLLCPILVHASTDPTVSLYGGNPGGSPLGLLVSFSNYLIIATGLVLTIVFAVRERRQAKDARSASSGSTA